MPPLPKRAPSRPATRAHNGSARAAGRDFPCRPRRAYDRWRRALTMPRMLDGVGMGNLCRLREQNHYGRELPVATVLASGEVALVKWLKKGLKKENAERCEPHGQLTSSPEKLSGRRAECPIKDLAARRGIFTHAQFET